VTLSPCQSAFVWPSVSCETVCRIFVKSGIAVLKRQSLTRRDIPDIGLGESCSVWGRSSVGTCSVHVSVLVGLGPENCMLDENLHQCHFAHHISHVDCPGIESALLCTIQAKRSVTVHCWLCVVELRSVRDGAGVSVVFVGLPQKNLDSIKKWSHDRCFPHHPTLCTTQSPCNVAPNSGVSF